ncbi:MAG: flavodoxin domain-containing protein [Verrucomicrobiota bacterium]
MNDRILILYGSVTGNSEIAAQRTQRALRERGYDPVLEDMTHVKAPLLLDFGTVLVVTSTYGEGEPPDGCEALHEAVVKDESFQLNGQRFAVLALGDTGYEFFCQCGRDYDTALERAGGHRLCARVDCDIDFDDEHEAWTAAVLDALTHERAGAA